MRLTYASCFAAAARSAPRLSAAPRSPFTSPKARAPGRGGVGTGVPSRDPNAVRATPSAEACEASHRAGVPYRQAVA